jgi:hypothetical protein
MYLGFKQNDRAVLTLSMTQVHEGHKWLYKAHLRFPGWCHDSADDTSTMLGPYTTQARFGALRQARRPQRIQTGAVNAAGASNRTFPQPPRRAQPLAAQQQTGVQISPKHSDYVASLESVEEAVLPLFNSLSDSQ